MRLPSGERVGALSFPVKVTCLCAGASVAGAFVPRSLGRRTAYEIAPTVTSALAIRAARFEMAPRPADGAEALGSGSESVWVTSMSATDRLCGSTMDLELSE